MPTITSNFEGTQDQAPIPEKDDGYQAHVDAVERNWSIDPNGRVIVTASEDKSKNPMDRLIWIIDEPGEHAGKKLNIYAHTIMLGGLTKENKPMPLFGLIEFLEATQTPHSCAVNQCDLKEKKAYKGTGKDGKKPGVYYCPVCSAELQLSYNDDDFVGRQAKLILTIEKYKDRENNKVKRVLPIS